MLNQEVLGVMEFFSHDIRQPEPGLLEMMTSIGSQIGQFIERKLAEEALRDSLEREQAARAEAEQANRLKDEFLATLSHELRNPLNNIVGYAEVLLQSQEENGTSLIRQAAEAILRNARAQAQLVSDLLDLSRLQTRKLAVERRPISLAPVVGDAVETARAQAEEKKIKLDVDIEAEPLVVNGDQLRIQQIVWNLVDNALKFTPKGGHVAVRLSREETAARLVVADTGQGIDPEFTPHIFEMFRQADAGTSRAQGGLGIGLALVRQIVELHEGRVEAYSEGPGRGARFTVRLPLHAAPAEAPAKAPASSAQGALTGARILVVDDTQDSIDMLHLLLESKGASVETALSGEEGLKTAEASEFDLIISDISMPGMDGYVFLQTLRENPRHETTPAIAITGFGQPEDVEKARKAGFTTHITKPINFANLVNLARLIIWK
jgi:two-component system CheB/CheR fusion protein